MFFEFQSTVTASAQKIVTNSDWIYSDAPGVSVQDKQKCKQK